MDLRIIFIFCELLFLWLAVFLKMHALRCSAECIGGAARILQICILNQCSFNADLLQPVSLQVKQCSLCAVPKYHRFCISLRCILFCSSSWSPLLRIVSSDLKQVLEDIYQVNGLQVSCIETHILQTIKN